MVTNIVKCADVRVTECGNRARLAIESRLGLRIADTSSGQDFDGDIAVEPRVSRAIDLTHPSGTNGGDDFVGTEARARLHFFTVAIQMLPRRSSIAKITPAGEMSMRCALQAVLTIC